MGPCLAILCQRWPQSRRPSMFAGLAVMVASLIVASFCSTVPGLLATQGVMYAVGAVWLYFPVMQLVDEWFIARKSQAFGIMWAATGLTGTVIPFLLQWLLDRYGYQTTLRVWAVVVAIPGSTCMPWLRPRLPLSPSSSFRRLDLTFFKRPAFWLYQMGNIGQSLGYFLPGMYIPSFAESLGFPSYAGPLALGLYNVGFSVGSVSLGLLMDRYHVTNGILVSTIGSLIAIFGFWGLTTSQPMLYMFALSYGMFGGCEYEIAQHH